MDTPPPPADAPEPPEFTPVPTASARRDGWTPARQARFLILLRQTGVVGYSARGVGMSHASAYKLRARPGAESFAAAWDRAVEAGYARAFDMAFERAVKGVTTPRYYRGKVVGTRHRFDDRLAIAALTPRSEASITPPRRAK